MSFNKKTNLLCTSTDGLDDLQICGQKNKQVLYGHSGLSENKLSVFYQKALLCGQTYG